MLRPRPMCPLCPALPEGPVTVNLPMMVNTAATAGLTGYGAFTYSGPAAIDGTVKDPITNFVTAYPGSAPPADYGSASNINSELQSGNPNNPSTAWVSTTGSRQWVYLCVNGACQWQIDDYQLALPNSECIQTPCAPYPAPNPPSNGFVGPRTHARLFGSQVADANSPYFTIADAHHDNYAHNCTDGWDIPRQQFENAIEPSDIASASTTTLVIAKTYQCAYHDGLEQNAWLSAY